MGGCCGADGKGSAAQPCVKSRSVVVKVLARSGDGVADDKGSDGAKGETVVEVVSQVVVVFEMEKARDVRSCCWSGNRRGSAQF